MKKKLNKKWFLKYGLVSAGIAASIAGIAPMSYVFVIQKEDKSPEVLLSKYIFWANDKNINFKDNNQSKILASTYEYASYTPPYSDQGNDDPNLKASTSTDKGFWPYQLQLESDSTDPAYSSTNRNPLFYLRTKNNAPIDVLKNDYNIYYRSYANDQNGQLFLKVSLEKKSSDLKSLSLRERQAYWIQHTYVIDGFAKITQAELDKRNNYTPWIFDSRNKLNSDFSNGTISSVSELLALLPTQNLDVNTQKSLISKNNATVKSYFSFTTKNASSKPYYILDTDKSIWFNSNVEDGDKITINYYLKKVVPIAVPQMLDQTTEMPLSQSVSQKITINFDELKEAAKQVEIVPFNNANLKELEPFGSDFPFFSSSAPKGSSLTNTSGGFYQNINLQFKSDFANKDLYELKFYKLYSEKEPIDGLKENNTPLVSYNKATGSAKFAYVLKLKNSSTTNGIIQYIGVFEMPNAFKKS